MAMKKPAAFVSALLLPCLAYVVVVAVSDRVFWRTAIPAGKERRAAVAICSNPLVTPFQKWGAKQFTWPYLDKYYDTACYFVQSSSDDCKRAFLSCLDAALERHAEVDLFLLAHTNSFFLWVRELPPEHRARLRLVYNSGCRNLEQGPTWLGLGAKAYVGHPGISESPVFYCYFLRRWIQNGAILQNAVDESNGLMQTALARMEFVAPGRMNAEKTSRETKAFCYGDKRLRFTGQES
jgi:hypothetical protein